MANPNCQSLILIFLILKANPTLQHLGFCVKPCWTDLYFNYQVAPKMEHVQSEAKVWRPASRGVVVMSHWLWLYSILNFFCAHFFKRCSSILPAEFVQRGRLVKIRHELSTVVSIDLMLPISVPLLWAGRRFWLQRPAPPPPPNK